LGNVKKRGVTRCENCSKKNECRGMTSGKRRTAECAHKGGGQGVGAGRVTSLWSVVAKNHVRRQKPPSRVFLGEKGSGEEKRDRSLPWGRQSTILKNRHVRGGNQLRLQRILGGEFRGDGVGGYPLYLPGNKRLSGKNNRLLKAATCLTQRRTKRATKKFYYVKRETVMSQEIWARTLGMSTKMEVMMATSVFQYDSTRHEQKGGSRGTFARKVGEKKKRIVTHKKSSSVRVKYCHSATWSR